MASPNMATITASLQNCSLHDNEADSEENNGVGRSDSSDDFHHHLPNSSRTNATLELNSQISLPHHWEQCLDLKTGEIYYINWRTGMKVKEDPNTIDGDDDDDDLYSEDEDSSYESEGSSSDHYYSPPSTSQTQTSGGRDPSNVLVVAGCKGCLMYFMVPKIVHDCPKCRGQLLHFDRSETAASP